MILQALYNYYDRMKDVLPSEGFEQKEIPFLIIINQEGEFINLQDTRTPFGKRLIARKFVVPKEHSRSGKNAWQAANLLWDHYGYVLENPKSDTDKDKEMAKKQHGTFMSQVQTLVKTFPEDLELQAVRQFYAGEYYKKVFDHPLWQDCKKINGCNLSFQISGEDRLICQNENVCSFVSKTIEIESDDNDDIPVTSDVEGICMITGKRASIARLHPRTPIAGAKSNAKIVSFQKNMGFDSYGKQQSYNAPVSKQAAFAYTTALNYMLAKDSRQKIYVGDTTTVFWAEKKHEIEDWFTDIFGEPAKGDSDQDNASIRALFESMKTGAPPVAWNLNQFYVLGLSPNAARIAIRFWYAGTVAEVATNILQHFKDISIEHAPHFSEYLSLFRLLKSTALLEKPENIQPNLAGDFMRAILAGTPYPATLLSSAVRRIRAEHEITYPRASLIKAVLVRNARFYKTEQTKEVGMSLDTSNTNIGYRLGRLFAVLEKIQEEAIEGINATIRDKFYSSASSTPVTSFPHLMKLKNHHLSKLDNRGRAVNLDKLVGEIVDGIQAETCFPGYLSLDDQGCFAIGYYHQRQDLFKKKDNS
ncbi:MAG: type I-C CRISPR-associated protein Cas8c/Csd1 [Nitrospirae bacterium]|nr:type I-C CRISPR-associated protein Cas8c/Csd1 [Nitrospirota bacterium]